MMRIWLDWGTAISAGASLLSAAGNASSASTQASYALQAGLAQSQFYQGQIPQVQLQEFEQRTDLANQGSAAVASAAAHSAAMDGDLDTGLISGIAGKYGMMDKRIEQDSKFQQWMLKTRADFAASEGAAASQMAELRGGSSLGGFLQGGYGLFKIGKSLINNLGGGGGGIDASAP